MKKRSPVCKHFFTAKLEVGNPTDKTFPTKPVLHTGSRRIPVELLRTLQQGDRSDGACSSGIHF